MSGRGFRGRGRGRQGSNTRYTGKRTSFRSSKPDGGTAYGIDRPAPVREDDGSAALERFEEVKVQDEIDEKMGFWRFESNLAAGEQRIGWLVNMHQVGCRLNPRAVLLKQIRLWSSRRHMLVDSQLWTFTSSRTTERCSRLQCRTNRTSTSHAE